MEQIEVVVIGGGAAGMMAAISAAKKGAKVTILEATERVGNKILVTGNGKCNFSNAIMDYSRYYCKNNTFLRLVFERVPSCEIRKFFEEAGMLIKNKSGYLYPYGEQASIVLDILRTQLKKWQVSVVTGAKVKKVTKEDEVFYIETEKGTVYQADRVVMATGGRSYPKTGSDGSGYKLAKKLGHTIVPTVPALVQLCGSDDFYKIIAGVRMEGKVSLYVNEEPVRTEDGEIQFTDYGISGIPIFQLSRIAAYAIYNKKDVTIKADVFPNYSINRIRELVKERMEIHIDNTLEEFMCGLNNKKLCLLAIKHAGKKPEDPVRKMSYEELLEMVLYLKKIVFHIVDTKGYETAQVTAGGVEISELSYFLQSTKVKGMFFAGEMIDVDGICGGYNLQWAFASGMVAGEEAANKGLD